MGLDRISTVELIVRLITLIKNLVLEESTAYEKNITNKQDF